MGRRGPPKRPTALTLALGNPGHRPVNDAEPDLAPLGDAPPKDLKGFARKEWTRLRAELVEKGVLTIGDEAVFLEYCELRSEVESYKRLIRKVGRTDAHKLGYAGYLLKLRAQMKQYAAELGLTPARRSDVKAVRSPSTTAKDERRRRFFGTDNGPGHATTA